MREEHPKSFFGGVLWGWAFLLLPALIAWQSWCPQPQIHAPSIDEPEYLDHYAGPVMMSRPIDPGALVRKGDVLYLAVNAPEGWDVAPLKGIEITWTQVYHGETCWGMR